MCPGAQLWPLWPELLRRSRMRLLVAAATAGSRIAGVTVVRSPSACPSTGQVQRRQHCEGPGVRGGGLP